MKCQVSIFSLFGIFLMVFSQFQASASHLMGGSLSYECLGGCTYRIYKDSYYDCNGAATTPLPGPPFAPAVNFSPATCTQPVAISAWQLEHYIEITPVCPGSQTKCTNPSANINGILESRFYRDYNFCNASCPVYTASWQSCCWNGTVFGTSDPIGMTIDIDLSHSPCNSSPQFTSSPVFYFCTSRATTIFQGAYDPDGDSLVYRFGNCFIDSMGTSIHYYPGFSPSAPLGPSWMVNLNSQTGQIDFIPTPGQIVQGVVCIYVEEWRNGVLIGEVSRDIQMVAFTCSNSSNSPVIDPNVTIVDGNQTSANSFETCVGATTSITFSASDADVADSVFASSNIASLFPGATITTTGSNPVQATIIFNPNTSGVFGFNMTFSDGNCPLPNIASGSYTISVDSTCIIGQVTHTPCQSPAGAIDITVYGGQSPYSYSWSNGATTEDLTGLLPGRYTVTATDANGLVIAQTFWVNGINLNIVPTLAQPDCNGVPGGIQIQVSGGMAPYTYLWNTGETTANLVGAQAGGYSVTATDANGCTRHFATFLDSPDSCYNFIEGYVYDDINQNCIRDTNEQGIPNVYVNVTPGGALFTDQHGYYKFRVDTGKYVVNIVTGNFQSPFCPASGVDSVYFSLTKQTQILNFAEDFIPVQDLRVSMYSSPARPGFSHGMFGNVRNEGSLVMSGTLQIIHEPAFTYTVGGINNGHPAPTTYDSLTSTATWSFSNLAPGQYFPVSFRTMVDSAAILGTPWKDSIVVLPIAGDTTPGNNVLVSQDTIKGAFDPNDKQVSPKGIRAPGYILPSEGLMKYTVRFQNTGTDTAFFVTIRDTLDSDLEISSFQPGTESHSYSLFVDKDSILVFTFNNILLPDSGTNLQGSQGHVSFYLRHNGTLSPGTVIENSAAIYFDFNTPVITNSVRNTIYTQPIVSAGNDTTICEGQFLEGNIVAAGMPPYDFVWNTGTIDLGNFAGVSQTSVGSSGSYVVSVMDAFGFISSDMVNVTAAPLPDAGFTLSQNNLTISLNSTAGVNTSWTWDFGDGNASTGSPAAIHTYASNGTYTVRLITSNDCGADTSMQVIDFTTDLEENEFAPSIGIQPNPFTTSTFVRFDNPEQREISIYLYDLQGRQVREYGTTGERVEVFREDLAKGIYLLEVRGEAVYYGRVVVE